MNNFKKIYVTINIVCIIVTSILITYRENFTMDGKLYLDNFILFYVTFSIIMGILVFGLSTIYNKNEIQ